MVKEECVESIIASMKLSHLRELIELFNIQIKGNKKKDYTKYVSIYVQNNIEKILKNFIIYDEWNLIRKICNEDYKIKMDKNYSIDISTKKSLEYLGIIYSYYDNGIETISIPTEIRECIKQKIYDMNIIFYSNSRQNIIDCFKKLLDIYGIVTMSLVEYYIVKDLEKKYRVHEIIKMLRTYNARCKLYHIDHDCNYYNLEIIDKEYIRKKIDNSLNLNFKYYSKSYLNNYTKELELNSIEKQIYIILNRHYKDSTITLECLKNIKIMIKNDISSKEISIFIKDKTKRLSELGRKMIERLIDSLREKYPLWILKGYSIEELQKDNYNKWNDI